MSDKIIAKYEELKAIVAEFFQRDKAEPEKFVEDIKVKVKEFSEMLEEPKDDGEL